MSNFINKVEIELKKRTPEELIEKIIELTTNDIIKDKEIERLTECLKEIDLIIYRLRFVEFLDDEALIGTLNNILNDIRYISQTGDYKNYMKRGK